MSPFLSGPVLRDSDLLVGLNSRRSGCDDIPNPAGVLAILGMPDKAMTDSISTLGSYLRSTQSNTIGGKTSTPRRKACRIWRGDQQVHAGRSGLLRLDLTLLYPDSAK